MADREKVRQQFEEFAAITEPGMPQCVTISAETVRDVLALLKEQRWIPVTIPPEKDGRYLCYYKDEDGECVDFGRYENGDWFVSGVAAYMTIPEPPKEED